jgi:hypothetical protein
MIVAFELIWIFDGYFEIIGKPRCNWSPIVVLGLFETSIELIWVSDAAFIFNG